MEAYLHRLIYDRVVSAKRPLFIPDERIDGDSLGASLAMADFLAGRGVSVRLFVKTEIPEKYKFLPHIEWCTTDVSVLDDPEIDLVVSFDCSDGKYVTDLVARIPSHPTIVNIDHHATNPRYGHVNLVVTSSPATAEVVHRWFMENELVPTREAATCLFAGICFDTTAFSNGATNERAFEAASALIAYGARPREIVRKLYLNRSVSALRLWGTALERLRQHPELGCISTYLTLRDLEEAAVSEEEVDGLSNFLNFVTESDTLCVLRETSEGSVKMSMRSTTKNVAAIAKAMGGGGHIRAAGFSVPNARIVCDESGCAQVVEGN
jgi:phosphoesterase RecJ-like protein